MTPKGQNYLENSQWLNVDLSLSRHNEGTYLELPSLRRKTEEQDRATGRHWVNCGEPGGLIDFIHILGVLDSEVNSPRKSY